MNSDTVTVIFNMESENFSADIEIPLDITANELVIALNSAYLLGIDTSDIKNCCLRSERPIALLKGNKTLKESGIRNGSEIYYTAEEK